MNIEIVLARALIDSLLFLEFSSDNVIDVDASVAQLEALASILGDLDKNSRNRFKTLCHEISLEDYDAGDKAEFIRKIPVDFGCSV